MSSNHKNKSNSNTLTINRILFFRDMHHRERSWRNQVMGILTTWDSSQDPLQSRDKEIPPQSSGRAPSHYKPHPVYGWVFSHALLMDNCCHSCFVSILCNCGLWALFRTFLKQCRTLEGCGSDCVSWFCCCHHLLVVVVVDACSITIFPRGNLMTCNDHWGKNENTDV